MKISASICMLLACARILSEFLTINSYVYFDMENSPSCWNVFYFLYSYSSMVLQILNLNISFYSLPQIFYSMRLSRIWSITHLHSYSLTLKSDKKVKFLNYVNFGFCDLKFTLKLIDELCLIFCCISDLSVFSAVILNSLWK